MLKHAILTGGALSLLALTASGQTEPVAYVKVADVHIKPSGYVVGSYQYTKSDSEYTATGSPTVSNDYSSDRFDLDAAKVLFAIDYKPVTGTVSVFSGADGEISLLDAFVTYDLGNGSTISGGKFLSWLGYEAFDIPNMAQITYAYANFNPIPGYHSGLKYNYTTAEYSLGVALLDSLYTPFGDTFKGDGSLKTDYAIEAFASYTGISGLTLWGGIGYQSEDDEFLDNDGTAGSLFLFNAWASYTVDKSNFGAEFVYTTQDDEPTLTPPASGGGFDAINLLGFYSYQFSDKVSTAFRVGYDSIEYNDMVTSPGTFMSSEEKSFRLTVAPSFKITDNLKIVTEVSYSKIDSDSLFASGSTRSLANSKQDDLFFGVQGRFTF